MVEFQVFSFWLLALLDVTISSGTALAARIENRAVPFEKVFTRIPQVWTKMRSLGRGVVLQLECCSVWSGNVTQAPRGNRELAGKLRAPWRKAAGKLTQNTELFSLSADSEVKVMSFSRKCFISPEVYTYYSYIPFLACRHEAFLLKRNLKGINLGIFYFLHYLLSIPSPIFKSHSLNTQIRDLPYPTYSEPGAYM